MQRLGESEMKQKASLRFPKCLIFFFLPGSRREFEPCIRERGWLTHIIAAQPPCARSRAEDHHTSLPRPLIEKQYRVLGKHARLLAWLGDFYAQQRMRRAILRNHLNPSILSPHLRRFSYNSEWCLLCFFYLWRAYVKNEQNTCEQKFLSLDQGPSKNMATELTEIKISWKEITLEWSLYGEPLSQIYVFLV